MRVDRVRAVPLYKVRSQVIRTEEFVGLKTAGHLKVGLVELFGDKGSIPVRCRILGTPIDEIFAGAHLIPILDRVILLRLVIPRVRVRIYGRLQNRLVKESLPVRVSHSESKHEPAGLLRGQNWVFLAQ